MTNLRLPKEPVRHLPIQAFLHLTCAGHPEPDPVPRALFFAAVLFAASAVFVL